MIAKDGLTAKEVYLVVKPLHDRPVINTMTVTIKMPDARIELRQCVLPVTGYRG